MSAPDRVVGVAGERPLVIQAITNIPAGQRKADATCETLAVWHSSRAVLRLIGYMARTEEHDRMNVLYLTREFPPHVYGGAGVHVEHLVAEMARLASVQVLCFGDQDEPTGNPTVRGLPFGGGMFADHPGRVGGALAALETGLAANARPLEADVVHCHTWYTHLGGILAKLAYGLPLVVTVHSLEPLRPWKREQLGRGYDVSCWVERTALEMADAVIAVSRRDNELISERFDVAPERLTVIPNGIDPSVYQPREAPDVLRRHGVDPDTPYVLFLGRITRQKGISHFLAAARELPPQIQVVLCASGADTPELASETADAIAGLRQSREASVVWIDDMVPRADAIALHSHAAVFCCPSVYEPFGIINLEAMACETPVVASRVGGIPDVVVPGETGELIALEPNGPDDAEPRDPQRFAADLAAAITALIEDPERRRRYGKAGRQRVVDEFGWDAVARRVHALYEQIIVSNQEADQP
jgi:glycogen synthase